MVCVITALRLFAKSKKSLGLVKMHGKELLETVWFILINILFPILQLSHPRVDLINVLERNWTQWCWSGSTAQAEKPGIVSSILQWNNSCDFCPYFVLIEGCNAGYTYLDRNLQWTWKWGTYTCIYIYDSWRCLRHGDSLDVDDKATCTAFFCGRIRLELYIRVVLILWASFPSGPTHKTALNALMELRISDLIDSHDLLTTPRVL